MGEIIIMRKTVSILKFSDSRFGTKTAKSFSFFPFFFANAWFDLYTADFILMILSLHHLWHHQNKNYRILRFIETNVKRFPWSARRSPSLTHTGITNGLLGHLGSSTVSGNLVTLSAHQVPVVCFILDRKLHMGLYYSVCRYNCPSPRL